MPTYQYRCTACGHDLEAVQKFTDAALTECPNCGGSLRKIFNAVGVVFKGSGFYRTDSRSADKNGSGSGDGSSKSDKSEKSDKTSTSEKPAEGGSGGEKKSETKSDSGTKQPAKAASSTGAKS